MKLTSSDYVVTLIYFQLPFLSPKKRKKATESSISDLDESVTNSEQGNVTVKEEIDAFGDGIRALDN